MRAMRLADAGGGGADGGAEVAADADALDVGVAVGQRDDGKARAQEVQRGQGVVEQRHALPLGVEDLERRLGQARIVGGLAQQLADRLAPDGAQVVRDAGLRRQHGLARAGRGLGVAGQRGGAGRVLVEPGPQPALGPLDRGPHGPQGVVEVERDGADARHVEHGARGLTQGHARE
jgi:hypothetical protein